MTEDEYDKFIPIQKEYVKNAYKKFYSIHKSDFDRLQKIIDAVPETPEEKAKMNALKNAIQNKIDAVHNEAIKAAKRKIGLTQK
jgi:CHASE3 domain sensor protein